MNDKDLMDQIKGYVGQLILAMDFNGIARELILIDTLAHMLKLFNVEKVSVEMLYQWVAQGMFIDIKNHIGVSSDEEILGLVGLMEDVIDKARRTEDMYPFLDMCARLRAQVEDGNLGVDLFEDFINKDLDL
jgi:hypothetical protein